MSTELVCQSETAEERAIITVDTLIKGPIEVPEDHVFEMVEPLFGFESLRRFLIYQTQEGPMYWLQSVEDTTVAFAVLAPFKVGLDPDYVIGTQDVADLGAEGLDQIDVYTVVTLHDDATRTTTNLRAPILVCGRKAKQVVYDNERLDLRFPLASLAKPPKS